MLRDSVFMRKLILHPQCESGPVTSVEAEIAPAQGGCSARFRLHGDMSKIRIPGAESPERRDFLWKTTCFEIFWQPRGGTYYREFNLSPSTCWAAYDFDDVRLNSRDAPAQLAIDCLVRDGMLELSGEVRSELPLPADVALHAIVEDHDGNIQFWAPDFAEGKPEFHSVVCRDWPVEGSR